MVKVRVGWGAPEGQAARVGAGQRGQPLGTGRPQPGPLPKLQTRGGAQNRALTQHRNGGVRRPVPAGDGARRLSPRWDLNRTQ